MVSNRGKASKAPAKKKPPAAESKVPSKESKKKPPAGKGQGVCEKAPWLDELGLALAALGLRVKTITADGNCLFRALADQLQGAAGNHMAVRGEVVAYMREHRSDFEPFMEEDEAFDAYCARMAREGTWGGQPELVAAARCYSAVLHIHQAAQAVWTIAPQGAPPRQALRGAHLAYHGGEHYNSVRRGDDFGPGPPEPIALAAAGPGEPAGRGSSAMAQRKNAGDKDAVCRVAQGTGCDNAGAIEAALWAAGGRVDEAIEILVERIAAEAAGEPPQPGGAANPEGSSQDAVEPLGTEYEGNTCTRLPAKPPASAASDAPPPAAACGPELARLALGDCTPDGSVPGHKSWDWTCTLNAGPVNSPPPSDAAAQPSKESEPRMEAACPAQDHDSLAGPQQNAAGGPASGGQARPMPASIEAAPGPPAAIARDATAGPQHALAARGAAGAKATATACDKPPAQRAAGKPPPRNRPCPCGAGRRYKDCCGPRAAAATRRRIAEGDASKGAADAAATPAPPVGVSLVYV